jgi:hypothetical protein
MSATARVIALMDRTFNLTVPGDLFESEAVGARVRRLFAAAAASGQPRIDPLFQDPVQPSFEAIYLFYG